MSVHHKDDCPCGSGKRYKHCHLPIDEARRKKAWMAGIGVVGAVILGGAAYGAWNLAQSGGGRGALPLAAGTAGDTARGGDVSGAPAPTPGAFGITQPGIGGRAPIPQTPVGTTIPVGQATNSALAPGENPTPWEYDVSKNRHYDPRPGHQHWHNGPPPADTTQAVVVAPRQIKLDGSGNVVSETAPRVAGSATTTGTGAWSEGHQALAPGESPKPWEYDAAKDRHFDPGHGHWHSGKPPAGK